MQIHAAPAHVAVERVLSPSHPKKTLFYGALPADSAFFAVVYALPEVFVIVQLAYLAEIACKHLPAGLTFLSGLLGVVALEAFDNLRFESIELVRLLYVRLPQIFGFIVTEPASEELLALLTSLLAGPPVVGTPILHTFDFFCPFVRD